MNAAYLGEYLDRNTAMARVEKDIEPNMEMVLHDWGALPESAGAAPDQQGQRSSMASRETSNASEDLDRRQFLVTAALTAAASCDVLGSDEKAGSLVEARQNLVVDFEGCNLGLIMAHRPELTPAENRHELANSGPTSAIVSGGFRCGGDMCRSPGPNR